MRIAVAHYNFSAEHDVSLAVHARRNHSGQPDSSAKHHAARKREFHQSIFFPFVYSVARMKLCFEGLKFDTQRLLPAVYSEAMKAVQIEETAASSSHLRFFNILFSIKL